MRKIRVGIIGLKPGTWGGVAHVPALRALADRFEVVAVANSNLESSRRAAEALDIPHALPDARALVESAEVDAVTVTITVPQHLEVVKAALAAGKHVYCEAPLGNGLAEAEAMAEAAREADGVAVVGLQARVAPAILYLRSLVESGHVGAVLSSQLRGWGGNWGPTLSDVARLGYLIDRAHGATMLTIPFGHTLAAVRDVLGEVVELSAMLDTRVSRVRSVDDGRMLEMTAADQIQVIGRLDGGAPFSAHYQGGMPNGTHGLVWDIHGTEGDLRITGGFGHAQMAALSIAAAKAGEGELTPLEVPERFLEGGPAETVVGNVQRNYARMARDIAEGTRTASTFDDAVGVQRVIDAIERASTRGERVRITPSVRPLPLP